MKVTIPDKLRDQMSELIQRATTSVLGEPARTNILAAAQGLLDEIGRDDTALDGDALINDNEDDGYWVTCRVFVRYDECEETP